MTGSHADRFVGSPVLRCERIGVHFDDWVLRHVDFELFPGEIVGLIGPGGHGKSVLLKCLPGLIKVDEGRVVFGTDDLATLKAAELHAVREGMGYLFQNYALFDFMTVEDNVAFPLRQQPKASRPSEREIVERAASRLTEVGLGDARALYPRELSGGMKKRVGLARATIANPRVGLYDDPSAGLDPVTSSKIFELIERLHRRVEGAATVIVSHDIDRMRAICDRYVFLWEGSVLFNGRPAELEGVDDRITAFFDGGGISHAVDS